jgi:glycosyltransferase 2 family protein
MKYIIYVITGILLILFLRDIDYVLLITQIEILGYKILGVIVISFVAYILGTLAWMYSINVAFNIRHLGRFFIVRQIGEALSITNPTGIVAGDAIKVYLMSKVGYNTSQISQSVIISRLLTWFSYLLVALFVLVFLLDDVFTSKIVSVITFIFLLGLAVLLLLILFHKYLWLHKLSAYIHRLTGWRYLQKHLTTIEEYNKDIYTLRKARPHYILIVIGLLVLHYLAGALEYYYILKILDVNISFLSALSMEVGTSLLRSVMAFIPGQIGVEEYGNKYFLSMLNVKNEGVWVVVSILRRIRQLWWILFGLVSYIMYTKKNTNKLSHIKIAADGYIVH